MTRNLQSLNLLAKLMVLHGQVLFSLSIAAIAEASLMRTSEQVPSLQSVAPRYFKLVTSSNFWPFMLISALMLFVLLVMILLFPPPDGRPGISDVYPLSGILSCHLIPLYYLLRCSSA